MRTAEEYIQIAYRAIYPNRNFNSDKAKNEKAFKHLVNTVNEARRECIDVCADIAYGKNAEFDKRYILKLKEQIK